MSKEIAIGKRLFELREELKSLASTATAHFFRLGEIMKEIRDNELWRGQYESFGAFYSDPDLGYKKSSVYHAIKLKEMFPNWKEIMDIPLGKLIMIAPHINETNREDLVSQARALSKSDLHHQLLVMRIATIEPRLAQQLPKIYLCTTCGKVKGVSFGELCHCGMPEDHVKQLSNFIDKLNYGGVDPRKEEEDGEAEVIDEGN